MRRPFIAGNWKMHGSRAHNAELIEALLLGLPAQTTVDIAVCPPSVYLWEVGKLLKASNVALGAQTVCAEAVGAFTGEVCAAMLKDVGCAYVIVGHSERRALQGETDAIVRKKAEATLTAGLIPIICVGETRAQREAGQVAQVVGAQVRDSVPEQGPGIVVAYEPVWAIGGDRTPTPAEIAQVHAVVRETLAQRFGAEANGIRILYGGSVGPNNAGEIFAAQGVDGALVGRASLKASDFSAIILAHPAAN